MTKTNDSRFLQHMLGLACIAALSAGCIAEVGEPPAGEPAPDASAMDVDPTGNWNLAYMLDAGCGQPAATGTDTFTVTRTPDGYAVSAPGVTTTGTLLCTPDRCKLSGMFAWAEPGAQLQQNANLSLDAHGSITGNGTEAVITMDMICSFTFTVHGMRI
jgi:hypothetical protein